MDASAAASRRLAVLAVATLFTLSGASGLIFEVIWLKYLTFAVGHTTLAVSIVVSAFLAGLVLGSLVLGRLADRARHPLRVYALLEFLTGVSALGLTRLLASLDVVLDRVGLPGGGPWAARVVLAFVLVLPPTFAMGGTLPALARLVARDEKTLGRSLGWLYSLNTLGAAAGCGLGGFFLIGSLGLFDTACLAAGVNVLIAALALLLSRRLGAEDAPAPSSPEATTPAEPLRKAGRVLLLMAFGLCGFASISNEVLWFRVLAGFFEDSTYDFAVLLVTFLTGLGLGGLIYARWLAKRVAPFELLVAVELCLAFVLMISIALLGQIPVLDLWAGSAAARLGLPGAGYLTNAALAAFIFIAPTTLIGIMFPAVTQLTFRHLGRTGSHVGFLYSVNTIGGIVGSLLTGFWLIPHWGAQRGLGLMCVVSAAVALLAHWLDPASTVRSRIRIAALAAAVPATLLLLPSRYLLDAYLHSTNARVIGVREGRDGTAAVLEFDRDLLCRTGFFDCEACRTDFSHRLLMFGSVSYASTFLPSRRYMGGMAHLPLLLHPAPSDVLLICFGTGTTAGALASHPGVKNLVAVDINPDIFDFAPLFSEFNHGVLKDPRVHAIVDDGRHYLQVARDAFDVVTLEPPPPTVEGAVNLYTREFYALARRRLRPGGHLAQWIPLDQQNDLQNRMLIRAMLDVFPEVSLWIPSHLEGVAIGSDRPLSIDLQRWSTEWEIPSVRKSMEEDAYAQPVELLGTYVAGTAELRQYVAEAAPVTDDRPAVEYFRTGDDSAFSLSALLRVAKDAAPDVPGQTDAQRLELQRSIEIERKLMKAYALHNRKAIPLALQEVSEAAREEPDNPYVRYLQDIEYPCLQPR